MTGATVYECSVCGDRKLVDHSAGLGPTLYCSHLTAEDNYDGEAFTVMDRVEDGDGDE